MEIISLEDMLYKNKCDQQAPIMVKVWEAVGGFRKRSLETAIIGKIEIWKCNEELPQYIKIWKRNEELP
ncbi:hypothetical protein L2E82_22368 [Cichorium intybus]|uniref:Uncharacterized protein n=1 Tax=Cichorium intybus TaxID=13427 RepID=A0ACB9DXM0_CICIN|nr:hypothetical protein L2E82_22368 [Cichorium intybus]